jgi:hypothetical protein
VLLACSIVSAWTGAAEAKPLDDAKAYVEAIYRAIPGEKFDSQTIRYAPDLQRLMQSDAACAARTGQICALDFVPFCECQDTAENYALLAASARGRGAKGATVTVTLRNGATRRFAVDLDWSAGVWRVADVRGTATPSLLAFLRRAQRAT